MTGKVLGLGFNRFYSSIFLRTLQPKALDLIRKHRLDFDYSRIQRADNLWDYDNLFTAPLHGFRGADDYWQKSSCRPYLRDIRLPTLLINARNDPFLPSQDEVSSLVSLDFPAHGGHAGFAVTDSHDWLAERLLDFLSTDKNT